MYVVCVTVQVKAEHLAAFKVATMDNAVNTRKEAANVRFDVLQAEEDPCRFFLYEAYLRKEDFAVHQQTAHYLRWKGAVAEWMAVPRVGVRHTSLFFGDAAT